MGKNVLRRMGAVAVVFLGLTCGSSVAAETMSWSPRTPAGGAHVGDPNFWVRQAVIAKWGADAVYLGASKNITKNSTTSEVIGGDRRYGFSQAIDDQGNVVLLNSKGELIEKRDDEITSRDNQGNFYYFTPQTSHVTTTQITETRAP